MASVRPSAHGSKEVFGGLESASLSRTELFLQIGEREAQRTEFAVANRPSDRCGGGRSERRGCFGGSHKGWGAGSSNIEKQVCGSRGIKHNTKMEAISSYNA